MDLINGQRLADAFFIDFTPAKMYFDITPSSRIMLLCNESTGDYKLYLLRLSSRGEWEKVYWGDSRDNRLILKFKELVTAIFSLEQRALDDYFKLTEKTLNQIGTVL